MNKIQPEKESNILYSWQKFEYFISKAKRQKTRKNQIKFNLITDEVAGAKRELVQNLLRREIFIAFAKNEVHQRCDKSPWLVLQSLDIKQDIIQNLHKFSK